mmetsp:Transcript_24303/g.79283  ORF Transcript_24303/g.79283 Transcript_24303/m.79283 type:complete len:120 (+) Transcript_24303:479-838(+)
MKGLAVYPPAMHSTHIISEHEPHIKYGSAALSPQSMHVTLLHELQHRYGLLLSRRPVPHGKHTTFEHELQGMNGPELLLLVAQSMQLASQHSEQYHHVTIRSILHSEHVHAPHLPAQLR